MNLLHWLKKTPQPVTVIADDKTIPVPRNARAYRDLLATITSLAPSKLTCMDKDGQVIRSIVLDDSVEDDRAAPSPEMSDLQVFARLLAEGYDRGARTNQPLVDRAMEFVERQSQRLAKAEAEIDRLRAQLHKVNVQYAELSSLPVAGESDNGGGDSIMGAVVAGVLQAQGLVPATPINKPVSIKQQPVGAKK